MFKWLFGNEHSSYERPLRELELAVDARKRAVLPTDKQAADKAMDDALRHIRTLALLKSDSFGC